MDQKYMDFIAHWGKQDEWSFFDLTGCPRQLLVHLFHLAELAQQNEIAMSMKWLTFDISPVEEIEQELVQWGNEAYPPPVERAPQDLSDVEVEKQLFEQQDRYHCIEAWRCASLLYLERVFKSDRRKRHLALSKLVRRTLDHIRCCRRSPLTQKQLLLPIFLADSDTLDEEMRGFVKECCLYWGEKSRYGMFNSVPTLLDEIWSTGKWWGVVIDSKTKTPAAGPGQGLTQLLFG
jgi:hypothetical protein